MKKCVLFLFVGLLVSSANAQSPIGNGGKQLNVGLGFSNYGTPVYVGADFGVADDITVGPQISYRSYKQNFSSVNYNLSLTVIGVNGNYHFDNILDLPGPWNVYAGLTLGYYIWSSPSDYGGSLASGIGITGQAGTRYYFSNKFGINLELGGGTSSGGKFGITYKF